MLDQDDSITLNIGNSNPVSMKELVGVVETALGSTIDVEYTDSRAGDMTQTFADIEFAKELLGWEPTNSIQQIVEDEIKWQKTKIKKR
jgi:UDP-glucose 4-epimerase